MAYTTDTAGELDRVDRILLGACAAIWLAALGAGVAAVVALVDLGGGRPESSGDSDTPWLLYTVIGVSAMVIVGAVPLLLRARRTALADSPPPARPAVAQAAAQPAVRGTEAPTHKLRVPGTASEPVTSRPGYPVARAVSAPAADPSVAVVDQLWLRCAVVIACAIGIAVVAVGLATYLMAVDSTAAAWVFYVLAGVITLGMPAIPWFYLRQLRDLLDKPAA
ncbi:DUF2561 family protein [Mycobacterium sp.]|uniref:DUF2561 family protein n=1 Tax=Mycobacterium sp. TaxID=1785 RepID=UPI002D94196D|nr:DUF2561 family protein [Mycobacterium sp.]